MFGWLAGQKRLSQKWPHTYQVRFGYFELPICFLGENPKLHNKTCTNKKTFINYSTVLMKPYKIPCYAECFCFELGQRYLYYYNIFAFTIHKITVIGTDKNTQKQLKNLAAKNNSEPVKNTGTKVHYEFSNFFRHPNETAPLSLTSAHI